MNRSDNICDIASALAKAQSLMKHATKDSTNPHFKSRYADLASVLDAIKEPFAQNGLSMSQHPSSEGDRIAITTMLMHSSGQFLESTLYLTPQQKTPQGFGSAITYARRYAAMAVAGLAPDDDDGNEASKSLSSPKVQKQQPKVTPTPAPADPKGSVYNGEGWQQEIIQAKLKGAAVPEVLWPRIDALLKGKPSGELNNVVKIATEEAMAEGAL